VFFLRINQFFKLIFIIGDNAVGYVYNILG